MGVFTATATKHDHKTQTGHSPPWKTSSLKHKFVDVPSLESQPRYSDNEGDGKLEGRFNLCCAWVSLVLGILLVILLILGVIFFSFFGSNLPDFHLKSLKVNKLRFKTVKNDTFMDSDIELALNVTNDDGNIDFYYTHLKVEIYSSDVFLGSVRHPVIHQKVNNSSLLKLHTVLSKQPVAEADYLRLQNDFKYHQMIFYVDFRGFIHYNYHRHQIAGFPFRVLCKNMLQYLIDEGPQRCRARMTPLT